MPKFTNNPLLTDRYTEALKVAASIHSKQIRKGDIEVPYLSHLLTVSSLVLEAGGNEDEAIAALLHDAVEDVNYSLEDIKMYFGKEVANVVASLSEDKSLDKNDRKQKYADNILKLSMSALRVSLADKLHNARCLNRNGHEVSSETIKHYAMYLPKYYDALCKNGAQQLADQYNEMQMIYLSWKC